VTRACFLDRDGVIIELMPDGVSVREPEQVRLCAGAAAAIQRLRAAGYLVVVVTNQPGPAKGLYTRESIDGAIARMHTLLADAGTEVDDVFVCLHHPEGGPGGDPSLTRVCDCRKPKPGMLLAAARKHGIDLAESYMIGDLETDEAAGRAAGCRTIRVGVPEMPSLTAAADWILAQ
jgi:D-glycero-D-manno-heptose 1,7-bisphosphate phosphatase